ncbi:AraC family transcriptional regulator [Pseudothauera nasutitermitis]|uniref:AraC family transcriptional regulator n=1 Tax=Pseudothauera nasutitermitis TaxID=2565930 RepID=A0A4S4AWL4_9RHOO|nr:AraC family transcriptional regulator [Pseudothauera nasutitermitis]THF64030.1 AraC family transcriptional regulator [Pseudothauera nasutitermitis]
MKTLLPAPADLTRGRAETPVAFIRAIILGYRARGMDPASALRQARIPQASLDDPAARVTAAQMETISALAMQELDDEALGWFSRRLPWGSYGMLARASLTSPTLEIALKRWCRHHRLLTEDLTLEFTQARHAATLRIREARDFGEMREFCLVSMLRNLLGYACWLIDSRIALAETTLPFPAPPHADAYPYLFPGPLRFDAQTAGFSFDARYLALPLRRDENALRAMLQRALPLTVHQYRRDRLLVHSVGQILAAAPDAAHTAEDVAARLNVSVRTLHRQLKEEGLSLQRLKNEVRREQAIKLLLQTQKPVKQVAAAVGFDSEKSFSRAFRAWTGTTPRRFRRQD